MTTDKLIHTLGMYKTESIQRIVNMIVASQQNQSQSSEDDEIKVSKYTIAYFFKVFITKLKIEQTLEELGSLLKIHT